MQEAWKGFKEGTWCNEVISLNQTILHMMVMKVS